MTGLQQLEHNIARCRVVLSLAASVAVYIDAETPLLARWIHFPNAPYSMDPRLFVIMAAHLTYSVLIYLGLGRTYPQRLAAVTTWVDVVFGVAIATMTEGVSGPAYPLFAFAVVASALRGGLRQATRVTTASLALYVVLMLFTVRGGADVYIMRPVYLAITGYLLGYLGQQRLELEEQMGELEVVEQRHRIARDLHDNYAQALAGINLRLEAARRLLKTDAVAETLADLTELQDSVQREFDDLRRYARALAGVETTAGVEMVNTATQLSISAEMSGSVDLVEHVLGIAREGIANVRRHARATVAKIQIRADLSQVHINIEDDGVGFRGAVTPWSIASRVKEIGGQICIIDSQRPGAHLRITLPQT